MSQWLLTSRKFSRIVFELLVLFKRGMGSLNISEVDILGVKDVFQKHTTDESKGIKVLFKMDDSGVLRVEKASI